MGENIFYRIIELIFSVVIAGVITVLLVLDNRWFYVYKNECVVPNLVFFAVFVILVGITHVWRRSYLKRHEGMPQPAPMNFEKTMKIIRLLSCFLFIFQLIYTSAIYFETGWDCRELVTAAQALAFDNQPIADSHYYSIYPNNVFLTGIFAFILKAVYMIGMHANYFPLIVVGCILVTATGYLFADCIRILTAKKTLTVGFWILYVLLTGLSPWISIPYSDTYSIFFPTCCIWLFLTKDENNYMASWLSITFIAFIGYFIKPTVILTYMVLVFFELIHFICNKRKRAKNTRILHAIGFVGMVALGFFLAMISRYGMEQYTGFTPDENKHFTAAHYLMMGANYEYGGGYNQTDVNASATFENVAERNAGDLAEAARRYKEMFPVKLVKFWSQKCLTNFNDGTYAWGNEGAFYWAYYDRTDNTAKFLRSYIYHTGENHDKYVVFCQFLWFMNLASCMIMFAKGRKNKDYREIAILTVMLAIMTFLMVFEARARYLYLYGPVIYMCGAMGINRLLLGKDAK